jgi:hypothetical protein
MQQQRYPLKLLNFTLDHVGGDAETPVNHCPKNKEDIKLAKKF